MSRVGVNAIEGMASDSATVISMTLELSGNIGEDRIERLATQQFLCHSKAL